MPKLVVVYGLESKNQTHNSGFKSPELTYINNDAIEMKVIPSPNDVLSGRGKHVFNHPGNIRLMVLVKQNLSNRHNCPKTLKPKVAEKIYNSICSENHHYTTMDSPGRFLKTISSNESDEHNRIWVEMDKKDAILKIRQAMRDYELRDTKRRKLLSDYTRSLKTGKA